MATQGADPDLVVVALGAHLPGAVCVAVARAQRHPQGRWLTDPGLGMGFKGKNMENRKKLRKKWLMMANDDLYMVNIWSIHG